MLSMSVRTAGGIVTIESVSTIVEVKIEDEVLFYGPAKTLADILRRDRDYMDYICSHDVDGRPYDWALND